MREEIAAISAADLSLTATPGAREEQNADLISYTAAVTWPVIVAGILTTLLVQQSFSLLGLSFNALWWLMLLSLNILASHASVLLGRLAQHPAGDGPPPSYSLASFALSIGVLASLALHAANIVIQIAGEQPVEADVSVAAYIVDAAFPQASDRIYALLVLIACIGAWMFGLGAIGELRRDHTLDRRRRTFLTALLLFSLNTLFLQAWIEPPSNTATITGVFWGAAALLISACVLSVLLRFASDRLPPFLRRLSLSHAEATAHGEGKLRIAWDLAIGAVLGLLWAIVALSIAAFGVFLVILAFSELTAALIFMAALARDLLAWLSFALPWAGLVLLAIAIVLISRRPSHAPAPAPGAAFTGWRLNAPPIWVFAAALICVAAFSTGVTANLFGAWLLAWLQSVFNTTAPLALAFVVFLVLAQITALAGVIVFAATRVISARGQSFIAPTIAAGRAVLATAAAAIIGLALASGGALVLFALVQLSFWIWTQLAAHASVAAAAVALALSAAFLAGALPRVAQRLFEAWRWAEPRLRKAVPAALALALMISAVLAATPLYPLLASTFHNIAPRVAASWNAVLIVVPLVIRPFVGAFGALAFFTLATAGAGAITVALVSGLADLGVRAWRLGRRRPRLATGALAVALGLAVTPALWNRMTAWTPKNISAERTRPIERAPRVTAVQRLVFEQGRWRFSSIYDVRNGLGSYTAIEAAIPDDGAAISSLCAYDAIVVMGAASSDGSPDYNRVLAQCRALSVGEVLQQRLARCEGRRPHLLVMNLSVSNRLSAAPADRIVAIAGVSDLANAADVSTVSAALEAQPAQVQAVLGGGQTLSNYPDRALRVFGGVGDCPRTWPRLGVGVEAAGDVNSPAP